VFAAATDCDGPAGTATADATANPGVRTLPSVTIPVFIGLAITNRLAKTTCS
jgi:hypothetical protein